MVEQLKLGIALLFVCAGIAGFYLLAEQPTVLRVLSVLAGMGAGALTAGLTSPGKQFFSFFRESISEAKKVVWPSKNEASKMTMLVFLFVTVTAIVLWLADKSLEWILYGLVLGWK